MQVGCGGLCGSINLSLSNASGCLPAMNGEFVVAATDMGHHGSMMDASWAEDPQKRIDFARRANHLTAVLAKAVMQTLYRQPPKYAYFMGCSDGGREALMEARAFRRILTVSALARQRPFPVSELLLPRLECGRQSAPGRYRYPAEKSPSSDSPCRAGSLPDAFRRAGCYPAKSVCLSVL